MWCRGCRTRAARTVSACCIAGRHDAGAPSSASQNCAILDCHECEIYDCHQHTRGEAPSLLPRCDNAPQKKRLWDKWNIRPLIDTRLLWQAEKEEPGYDPGRPITRALFPDRADVVVHDERGRVSCICSKTGEERALAFQCFEADRGACFECAGHDACHRAGGVEPGEYGRIVRIDLDSYDRSFNFETHYIRGLAKTKARVGLALAVMTALALGQVRAGHVERMRSLVGAVPLRDTG